MDRRTWAALAPILAPSLRLLTFDRRNHGASRGPVRVHPVQEDASDLAELLVATDLYPAHVVAHSYGGCVALALATQRPELVRSLAIHEAPAVGLLEDDPASVPIARGLRTSVERLRTEIRAGHVDEAARAFVDEFAADPTAWDRLAPPWKEAFRANAPRWLEEFSDPATDRPDRAALTDFLSPVLLTEGGRSPEFLHRMSAAIAGTLRNATVRRLPDAGHFPHLTDPQVYAAVLLRFLVERDVPAM